MATSWYYAVSGKKHGPIDSKRLKELAEQGVISPTDLIWRDGMSEWAPAAKVKGLFPADMLDGAPPIPTPVAEPMAFRPAVTQVTVQPSGPREGVVAKVAKWITLGWTLLCVYFVFAGVANVGPVDGLNDAEKAGTAIGVGCGVGIIFIMWMVIALPAVIVWLVSRKS